MLNNCPARLESPFARYVLIPNGLGQSYIGVKGNEAIAGDWSLVFNLQTGFNPYTLERANGPKSLVQNNTTPLDAQSGPLLFFEISSSTPLG